MRIILIFILFFFNFGNSQVKKNLTIKRIDSTLKSIDHIVSDNEGRNLTSLCKNIYKESKRLDYTEGQMKSLQKLCIYRINANKDYETVISDSKTIEELARHVDNNYYYCFAKLNKSFIFLQMGLYKKSDALAREALRYAPLIKDNDEKQEVYVTTYFIKACYYEIQKDSDKALFTAEKLYEGALMMTDAFPRKLIWILSSTRLMENFYFNRGDYKKAEYYLVIHKKYLKESKVKLDFALYHILKAELEFKSKTNQNYLDSTIYHYKEAEKYSKQIHNAGVLGAVYSEISDVYAEKKDLKNQALYLEKSKKLKDSLNNIQKGNFQKISLKTGADHSKAASDKSSRNYIFLLLIPLLGLGLFFFYKSKNKAKKTDKSFSEKKYSSLISTSELANLVNEPDLFNTGFQKFFPDFYTNLLNINPALDKSSLELCAFIKLNFDTKKIATIKNISVRTVENRKYMLRKKLNIEAYDDLYIWMSKI